MVRGYEVKRQRGMHGNRRPEAVGVRGKGPGLMRQREKYSKSPEGEAEVSCWRGGGGGGLH